MNSMVFATRGLKCWVLGPPGHMKTPDFGNPKAPGPSDPKPKRSMYLYGIY